ncbi:nitrogen regulatory protein p-ii [hydrocarbon metagenome]|uniref:Nitrogen regulatory protein p-ii n=1 Tax=hydrocarbon metagenome TaxID=938273 RepID=A0A0W8E465_9ZZZZ
MDNNPQLPEFELLCVILNFGLGSKVIKLAKRHGVTGGTIFLGKGTVKNRILELLDLTEIRKEIVVMISTKDAIYKALEAIKKEFKLNKKDHGIAFTTRVINLFGSSCYRGSHSKESRGVENTMYKVIYVIVDRGRAATIIEIASKAGSSGGTVINARGSGIHETSKLFAMDIEPEKELVLLLCEEHLSDSIISSVREQAQIDKPGNGIIFVQNVDKAYGLYTPPK